MGTTLAQINDMMAVMDDTSGQSKQVEEAAPAVVPSEAVLVDGQVGAAVPEPVAPAAPAEMVEPPIEPETPLVETAPEPAATPVASEPVTAAPPAPIESSKPPVAASTPEPSPPTATPLPDQPAPVPAPVNTGGLSPAVLALTDEELKQAAAHYLRKNQAVIGGLGVAARKATMQQNLERITAYVQANQPTRLPRIAKNLNITLGTTSHYLQILIKQKKVVAAGWAKDRTFSIDS